MCGWAEDDMVTLHVASSFLRSAAETPPPAHAEMLVRSLCIPLFGRLRLPLLELFMMAARGISDFMLS
jgi:hypothetical protein